MAAPAPLLFDLDGTLLDSLGDITASLNAVRRRLGARKHDAAFVMTCIGDGLDELLRRGLADIAPAADAGGGPGWFARIRADYRVHYGGHLAVHTRPYDGVAAGLAQLAARGHPMAVVSNKPEGFCRRLVERFGFGAFLPVVVGGDTTARPKPHADPVRAACDRLGAVPGQAWMVGDSPGDLEAARRAGCPVRLAATWGYRPRALLAAAPQTGLLYRFDDLVEAAARPA